MREGRKSVYRRWCETVDQMGVRDAFLYVAARALHAMSRGRARIHKYYFMAQPVAPSRLPGARDGSFAFSFVDASHPALAQCGRAPGVIAARFAQGAQCLLATGRDGRFAGFLWFVVGPYDEDEVRARFRPLPDGETAWDFDVEVRPEYRMSRLFSALWKRAGEALAAKGVTHTTSRISAFNAASLASHRRLGATCVGSASFLCIARWQFMISSLAPRLHLSRSAAASPVLAIPAGARSDS